MTGDTRDPRAPEVAGPDGGTPERRDAPQESTAPATTDAATPDRVTPDKAAPEALKLRADPRRVVRFRRGIIIGATSVGAILLAGVGWRALESQGVHLINAAKEQTAPERRTAPEAVANLPNNYGDSGKIAPGTPVLGPPLPGDLGRAILDRQRQLEAGGGVASADPAAGPPEITPQVQAAEAERQRLAAQSAQAREAGVMVQSSGRTAATAKAATTDPAPSNMAAPSASLHDMTSQGGTPEGGRVAFDPERDQNNQQRKLDFVGQTGSGGIYNPHRLQTPASPYEVLAGSVIAASLITGLNSDLPGQVIAQVTENVYDTVTGRFLLIPQGSRLIGSYDSVVAFGQRRALLVWQRIILPDGASLEIDNLPATDAAGYAGLADKVDFHTWQLLKGVGLSTLLGVGTELSMSGDSDLVRAIRQSTQQSAAQAGQQIVGKSLNIQPTLTVRPGWPLRVVVHRDLILRQWTGQSTGRWTEVR